jgi:hypothetical protein
MERFGCCERSGDALRTARRQCAIREVLRKRGAGLRFVATGKRGTCLFSGCVGVVRIGFELLAATERCEPKAFSIQQGLFDNWSRA